MKSIQWLMILIICHLSVGGQNIGIGTNTPNSTAALEIKAANKGLLIPRTSSVSRMGIVNPAKGLMLYDSTTGGIWFHNGTAWLPLESGNNGWSLTGNAGTNPATHFVGTTNAQPLRFRVNNEWAGEIHPTTGNVFLGLGSGKAILGGEANAAFGDHALFANTNGGFNTASGYYALAANTTGSNNTALGGYALNKNTTGGSNTAVGRNALFANTTGVQNTANGEGALLTNIAGGYNTATGYQALFSNIGSYNTANGNGALYTNSNGNANTANGYWSLYSNTSGLNNTANGMQALYKNSTGNFNTANGSLSLLDNTTGSQNTAIGSNALQDNITGSENTAIGRSALLLNTAGSFNAAIGVDALRSNKNGTNNTASGANALYSNDNGSGNTALGSSALYNNISGNQNISIGMFSLYENSIGYHNVALGASSLYLNSSGHENVAIGLNALENNETGSRNIAIGYSAGTHPNTPAVYNTISIGNDDMLNAYQNQVFLGNTSTQFIGGKVNWAVISDARIKNNILEDVKGLDFILKLRPVTYHMSNNAIITLTGNVATDNFPGKYDGEKVKYTGFLAQEVEQAAKAANYEFSGYETPKNEWGFYSIKYAEFVVPLVKAMQEQQLMIEALQKENAQLKTMHADIEKLKAALLNK